MRRRFVLAALAFALPLPLAALAHGCTPKAPTIQDFCGFLGDENNCYSTLIEDIGARCGVEGDATKPIGSTRKGYFLERDKLDVCTLSEGGQIAFDTPLSVDSFPVSSIGFTVRDATGTTCGTFRFTSPTSFAIKVDPATAQDGGVLQDAGSACNGEGGAGGGTGGSASGGESTTVCGGSFSAEKPEGDFVETTCGKEVHTFISLQLDKCEEQKKLLPRFEIETLAGGIDIPGYVRLRVFYPPTSGAPSGVVDYFDCSIPGALKGCCNGIKDGFETDTDCGGATEPAEAACDRCAGGQSCISSADCRSGATCGVDTNGIKLCGMGGVEKPSKCNPPDAGDASSSSGSGASSSSGTGGAGGSGSGGAGGSGGA